MVSVHEVRHLVELALTEDLTPLGDITSSLLNPDLAAEAHFVARESGTIYGRVCVDETFRAVDESVAIHWHASDGEKTAAGQRLATVNGSLASILTAERTALNFLSHLSGVATNAARWVDIAAGRVTVWDTRKTMPGYRSLQKAAVRAGGAANHRANLSDWLMFKDNHLTGISITEAVALAKAQWPGRTVHVEADTAEQVIEAVNAGADIILLDNFTPDQLRALVPTVRARAGDRCPLLEASGGITLDTLDDYATTGVDLVSSGSLTNSAPVLDIGLDILP